MWSACTILHTWARENLFSLNLVHHWHTCFVLHMLKPIELHHVMPCHALRLFSLRFCLLDADLFCLCWSAIFGNLFHWYFKSSGVLMFISLPAIYQLSWLGVGCMSILLCAPQGHRHRCWIFDIMWGIGKWGRCINE